MDTTRRDVHNSDVPVLCRSCEARHRGICGALAPDQLVTLARSTHKVRHLPGAELMGEGTTIETYANVMSGVVKLTKVLEDGRQQVVGLQFAPDFLGRLFGSESMVGAEAASSVDLCIMPKGALEALMARNPALGRKLMTQTLRELDEARDWMVTLGRKTALERVASFLHRIAAHARPASEGGPGTSFELPLTRADMADFLGLTIETVSRQLTRLRQSGVIAITGLRHVEVPDLERLKAMCG